MITTSILEKIESLPPLPKTVIEIEEFRKQRSKDSDELLEIIEKDALVVATLLKISNSAMFGFRSKVETPGRAISLLGINFTISIIIGGTIQNLLVSDLTPYNINNDDFMKVSNISSTLSNLWLSKLDGTIKEDIILPALLQEVGKYILADIITQENKVEEFQSIISDENIDIKEAEKKILGVTTSQITAMIFKQWKLSDNVANIIEYVDDISKCEDEYKVKTQILDIIKTACDIRNPLASIHTQKAISKAKTYGIDTKYLIKSIEKIEDKILDGEL